MSDVVLFGVRDFAELAHFYLTHDSEHRVVAFTVDAAYLPESGEWHGLPVVAFETLADRFPPDMYRLFAPMSHRHMNRDRQRVYETGKAKGYEFISYVSSKATRFAGTSIGENCFILEDNTIQPFVTIGNNVVLWSGNHIGHHSTLADHVFFTSHVVLSGHCAVESHCFFGVNATLRDNLHIGQGSLVGMGACVTRDTDPWGIYVGNPAKKSDKRSDEVDF